MYAVSLSTNNTIKIDRITDRRKVITAKQWHNRTIITKSECMKAEIEREIVRDWCQVVEHWEKQESLVAHFQPSCLVETTCGNNHQASSATCARATIVMHHNLTGATGTLPHAKLRCASAILSPYPSQNRHENAQHISYLDLQKYGWMPNQQQRRLSYKQIWSKSIATIN